MLAPRVTVGELPGPLISDRATQPVEFRVVRAGSVRIDGTFDDWADAEWIEMSGAPHHFADNVIMTVTIEIPDGLTPAEDHDFLGFRYDQMDPDYARRYALDGFYDYKGVVITAVDPGSPAERGSLREGDVIFEIDGGNCPWAYEVHRWIEGARQRPGSRSASFSILRSGRDRLGGPQDLSARVAFMIDDASLFFAAQVTDDVHEQRMVGADSWKNDCVQIGIDPTLARFDDGYGPDGHEIGLVLKDGKPFVWGWTGRRPGGDRGAIEEASVAILRDNDQTLYEAAIPLTSLVALSPDLWPRCGMNVVVNDSDDGVSRKGRLELCPGAMTLGKQLNRFAVFEFAPSPDGEKISFAWFWDLRLKSTGRAAFKVAARSPTPTHVRVVVRLESWSGGFEPRDVEPAFAEPIRLEVGPEAREWWLEITTRSQPAEYRIEWVAYDPQGNMLARDGVPFFVRY